MHATIAVTMRNEFGQIYEDEFSLTFNLYFYRRLKWFLLVPFTLMSGMLLFVNDLNKLPLPM